MKTYNFSKEYKYFIIPLILIFFTIIAIPPYEGRFKVLGPFILVFTIYLWYRFFTSPYKILINDNNKIEFYSIFNKFQLHPEEIKEIKDNMSTLVILHSKGKTVISSLMNNTPGFRNALLSLRPDLKIEDIQAQRFDGK